jgi:hypothetical protein
MSLNESPLKEGMHAPLRNSPAPILGILFRAVDRIFHAFGLRRLAENVYLEGAKGQWIEEYAALHAYSRLDGESDEALRARMQRDTILNRMVTTEQAILASILRATNLTVRIRPTRPRVASFDHIDDMAFGDHMLDYGVVDGDNVIFENIPESVSGSSARLPWRPAWGPGGMVIDVGLPYDETLERSILQAILDEIPSMAGIDLAWSKDLIVSWSDNLSISDGGKVCYAGWGEESWGGSGWGSECNILNDRGWGVEPWGKNWGSRKLVRVVS